MARTLAALGTDERALGRVWHVPSGPPRSQRAALTDLAAALSAPAPTVRGVPWGAIRALGLLSPVMREVLDVRHQFDQEYVVDATDTTETSGIAASPWAEVVAATAGRAPAAA